MNGKETEEIRKLLTTIEKITRQANATTKMDVLQMLGMTSQSVIAMAKKLTEPKTKTKTKVVTRYKDKPQQPPQPEQVKTDEPPTSATDKPATPFQTIQPQPPIPPLSIQRNSDNES